jgi:hypothetical protein
VTDFFREVQEDLQRDRYLKLWRRFRYPLLGVAVAIVAAVIVVVVLEDTGRSAREAESERFAAAEALLTAGKPSEAAEAFAALAVETDSGYHALARLREADAKALAGDLEGAVAVLDALARDAAAAPQYRELATLQAAERLIDSASPEEIDSRLATLLVEGSPWRPLALELKGTAELHAGRNDAARVTFTALVEDPGATAGVRFRARELLDGLGGPLAEGAAETGEAGEASGGAAPAKDDSGEALEP